MTALLLPSYTRMNVSLCQQYKVLYRSPVISRQCRVQLLPMISDCRRFGTGLMLKAHPPLRVLERLDARSDPEDTHPFYVMNVQIYLPQWQEMRGVFELPHSCGKHSEVAVFTTDPQVADAAYDAGAKYAGDIRADMRSKRILPRDFKLMLATRGLRTEYNTISDYFVRTMRKHRRKLPAVWNCTFLEPERIPEATWKHTHGYYTTLQVATRQKKRIITTPIGQVGMDHVNVLQNFEAVLHQIMAKKPNPKPKKYSGKWQNREAVPDSEFIIKVMIGMLTSRAYNVDFRPILVNMGYIDPTPRQRRKAKLRRRRMLEQHEQEQQRQQQQPEEISNESSANTVDRGGEHVEFTDEMSDSSPNSMETHE